MRLIQKINMVGQLLQRGMIVVFSCVMSCGVFSQLQAQDAKSWEKEGEGEIKDVEIEIVKDRKITLPRANRNFEKVPPRPYEPIKPSITYELKTFKFTTPEYKPSVRPLKLKGEELSKIYGNYVSAGLGNYASYFVEGSITTKRDKNTFLGAHFYNRTYETGPVDGKNSAASTTNLQVFAKSMSNDVTISGEANYENRGGYFYGYSPGFTGGRDDIRQTYTQFGLNAGIENTKPSDFNYLLKAGYSNLKDHYSATEDEVSLSFNSNYNFTETSKFILNADYFLISRKDLLLNSDPRHLFRIKPAYQFVPFENLTITVGVNIAIQKDPNNNSKSFHAYPHIKAHYQLSPSLEAYGIVTGDMDKVNLHTLSAENMWLDSGIPAINTNRSLELQGGLKGKVGRKFSIGVGFSVAALKNYYFYLNRSSVSGILVSINPNDPIIPVVDKFVVLYDGNTRRFNPFAEISFAHSETASFSLRADYFSYSPKNYNEVYNRPSYRISANSKFNIFDKIVLEGGFIAQGGMRSILPGTTNGYTIDPAFDLNMKTRYFISKQVSAFVQLNNILSSNYPIYQNYPARGFQALVGASWSF